MRPLIWRLTPRDDFSSIWQIVGDIPYEVLRRDTGVTLISYDSAAVVHQNLEQKSFLMKS
jgi:hypothetical protein